MSNKAASQCNGSFGEFFHLSAARILRLNSRAGNFNPVAIFVSRPEGWNEDDARIDVSIQKMRTKRLQNDLYLLVNSTPATTNTRTKSGLAFFVLTGTNVSNFKQIAPITDNAGLPVLYRFLGEQRYLNTYSYNRDNISTLRTFPWKQIQATLAIAAVFKSAANFTNKGQYQLQVFNNWTSSLTAAERTAVQTYISSKIPQAEKMTSKIILWSRVHPTNEPWRNMNTNALRFLLGVLKSENHNILIFGETDGEVPTTKKKVKTYDFTKLYDDPVFDMATHHNSYARQLYLLHYLYTEYNLQGIIGAKSGFIDGAALMGIPVISLEYSRDSVVVKRLNESITPRMHTWVRPVIPNYIIFPTDTFLRKEGGPSNFTNEERTPLSNLIKMISVLKNKAPSRDLLLPIRTYFDTKIDQSDLNGTSYNELKQQFM